jgi:LysR family nitrogen assimilation transcriptional regulator
MSTIFTKYFNRLRFKHPLLSLRQCEQARVDMNAAERGLSGAASVGLAPGTAAASLALPLLRTVRARHPGVLLYLNETYGTTLSELIMNGRMDLAVLYGGKTAVHGLSFLPLLKEQLFVVGPKSIPAPPDNVPLRMLGEMDLYLARPYNVVRRMVDEAFATIGMTPRVVAEIESASTLTAVIADGLGATILPASMAREVAASCGAWMCRIVDPSIEAPLALCQSDHLPLSEPAQAIKEILLELIAALPGSLIAADESTRNTTS